MLRLLKVLFLGHLHEWVVIERHKLFKCDGSFLGFRYVLQCKECGELKIETCNLLTEKDW